MIEDDEDDDCLDNRYPVSKKKKIKKRVRALEARLSNLEELILRLRAERGVTINSGGYYIINAPPPPKIEVFGDVEGADRAVGVAIGTLPVKNVG